MKRIVILGAGTGGTMMANKLVRVLPDDAWRVTVVDRDDIHLYQPGLLFLPFGQYRAEDILKRRKNLLDPRVELRLGEIDRVAPDESKVYMAGGAPLPYDVLVVATGSRILPELTQGLTGAGWKESAFDFYTLEGALALRNALDRFKGGRVVVNVAEMPIKCPVAPLEFLFLAEAFFTGKGIRDKVEIVYTTPLEGAFTKPKASAAFGDMLSRRGISVLGDFSVSEVDGQKRVMKSFDGRETNYDLLVSIPVHGGSESIAKSGMGDVSGWLPVDKHTLQSPTFSNVFALGDATNLPASKAGAVAHFQSEVLFDNVLRFIGNQPLSPTFDGHANCFIETGYGKAMLIDFNYETEPLPGRYPLPGVGPFTLLEESATNHWGKLAFKWIYWNVLLEGKELPLDHRMLLAGEVELIMETIATKNGMDQVMARLDAIDARLTVLVERQQKNEELFSEMTPILREVLGTATTKLDVLDKKGYFAFGKELVGLTDRVVTGFAPEDVRQLGDAVVGILQAVRAMTQPKILEIVGEASEVLEKSDEAEPIGLLGMVRATGDDDVQKGMAVLMQVMRHVGRAARAVREQRKADPKEEQKAKLASVLGARKKKVLGIERPSNLGPPAACAVPSTKPREVAAVIDGVAFGADGHLLDAKVWTRALAVKIAAVQGLELDDTRWAIIQFARADFEHTSVSPNIRRLTQGTNLATKDIYTLFPKAPARTVAKIAGIPKPAGCI